MKRALIILRTSCASLGQEEEKEERQGQQEQEEEEEFQLRGIIFIQIWREEAEGGEKKRKTKTRKRQLRRRPNANRRSWNPKQSKQRTKESVNQTRFNCKWAMDWGKSNRYMLMPIC